MKAVKQPTDLHSEWSASPAQCGSCQYFERRASSINDPDTYGICLFELPPFVREIIRKNWNKNGGEVDGRTVSDRDACDLYKSTGQQYSRKQYWTV